MPRGDIRYDILSRHLSPEVEDISMETLDQVEPGHSDDLTPPAPQSPPQDRPEPRWRRVNPGVVILVVGLLVGAFALGQISVGSGQADSGSTPSNSTVTEAAANTTPLVAASDEPIAAVAAALTPAMVQIETQAGLGSGVIYDTDGLILTAAHVVEGADQVIVQLADGTRVDGTVVGADVASDVAVVSVDVPDLVAAPLAVGQELLPGQIAIAIGSPFGLDQTVTAGVISSTSRAIPSSNGSVNELIQTDAPINPGNSGGALADLQGQVIGINDQIFSQSGGNEGVGFAIPITRAKDVADRLVAGETIETAYLGVTGTDTTLGQAGAVITSVQPGTPAADAGLQDGDLVVAVDGSPIESFTELAAVIRSHAPGDTVSLTIQRADSTIDAEVTLANAS